MKHLILVIMLTSLVHFSAQAQESFGKALNLGLGAGGYSGYYGYADRSFLVFHVDYEFEIARSLTLGPTVSLYTFSDSYHWGDANTLSKSYSYRQIVIPIGIKGSYYFDDLLNANERWDFYAAGSLGLTLMNSRWDKEYNGDKNHFQGPNSILLDLHVGAEYHFYSRLGIFLDISTGVSMFGLTIH